MSVASERPRGPPGPQGVPTGSPAPRRKILVRKVKRPEGSVATTQDGLSTRATTPQQSTAFGHLSTSFDTTANTTARGGKGTRAPASAPGTPPEVATEAAIAPRGPKPGRRGKREEWSVLGDVGASPHAHLRASIDAKREQRLFKKLFKRRARASLLKKKKKKKKNAKACSSL